MLGASPADLLPAIWVAAVGAALAWALRRWFDPVPPRIWAAFAALILALYSPILVGGELLLPLDGLRGAPPFHLLQPAEPHGNFLQGDLLLFIGPSLARVRAHWAEGSWPLWNPLVGAGMPLLADPQAQALQPLALLALLLPLPLAAAVLAALRVLLALAGTFLLLRRQGLPEGPALFGAVAYGLGGFVQLWLGWPLANTAALLPLALYALVRVDEDGGRRDQALLTATVAALLLSGHPETTLYALGVVGALLLARSWRRARPRALLVRGGGALAVAALVAAPALLPAASYLPQTVRGERLAAAAAASVEVGDSSLIAEPSRWRLRLTPLVAPNAFGNSRYGHYWGGANSNEDASGFAGTVALLLLLAGGLTAARRVRDGTLVLALGGIALLLMAPPSPGAAAVARLAALLGSPSEFHRLLLVVNLAVALLAAGALDSWRQLDRAVLWRLPLAGALLAGVLLWSYWAHPHPAGVLEVFHHGWMLRQLKVLALATSLLLLFRRRSWLPLALSAVLAGELYLLHGPANPPMPARLAFPVPGVVAFLQQHQGPDERMAAVGDSFRPNLPSLYGLADARVFNPVEGRDYHALTRVVAGASPSGLPAWVAPGHPLYDLLGVRWLYAPPDEELPAPLVLRHSDSSGRVYERPRPLPRLFLPATALELPRERLIAAAQQQTDFGTRSVVAASGVAALEASAWTASDRHFAAPALVRLGASAVTARVELAETRLLASSIFQDGGWRLLVGGVPWATTLANGPFVASWLPAGNHRLDLLYRPPGFLAGALLAALGLAAGLCWWLPPPPCSGAPPPARPRLTGPGAIQSARRPAPDGR